MFFAVQQLEVLDDETLVRKPTPPIKCSVCLNIFSNDIIVTPLHQSLRNLSNSDTKPNIP